MYELIIMPLFFYIRKIFLHFIQLSDLLFNFHPLFEQNIIMVCDDYSKSDKANQAIRYKR